MNLQEIQLHNKQIDILLAKQRVFEALEVLNRLITATGDYELTNQLTSLRTAYDYMLQFFVSGADDPQRNNMLDSIISQIYTLRDTATIELSQNESFDFYYSRHDSSKQVNLAELLDQYRNLSNKCALLSGADNELSNETVIDDLMQQREKTLTSVFNKVWCSFPLSKGDTELLRCVFDSEDAETRFKSLLVSALFLGSCKFFDENKLALILHAYCNCDAEPDVQCRALVAFVLAIFVHKNRAQFPLQIRELLHNAAQLPHFHSDLKSVSSRLIRSRNTDNITKLMREDLMPNLMKIKSNIVDKIRGTNNPNDILDLEANPEWQDWLDKTGITKKIEELNELQFDGSDVFISAFSHLKSFPFFNNMANWFLPFNAEHPAVKNCFEGRKGMLIGGLIKSAPMLCDSDKYSLCFSMSSMPEAQLQTIIDQFAAQGEQLKEMAGEKNENAVVNRDHLINQYVHDLYRFFKLYSRRRDFPSIFDTDLNLISIPLIGDYLHNKEIISVIAEFYFKNGFYPDAVLYYKYLLDNWNDNDLILYQKIGFAYQAQADFNAALSYYLKYDIVNDSDLWNLQHIAACYKALKNNDKAFDYYKRANELNPDNITTCLNLGHHYLEAGDLDAALKHYYKVDYLDTKKHRAWRPIAWCSFLKQDYEQSQKYYDKIISEDSPTAHDFLNYAHLLLCSQGVSQAVKAYVDALKRFDGKLDRFADAFLADAQVLQNNGIDSDSIPLILDTVLSTHASNSQK